MLFCLTLNSQNIKDLETQNTLFVVFEENEFAKKQNGIVVVLGSVYYTFYQNDKSKASKKLLPYWFSYDKYENLEDAKKDEETISYRVHKNFFKKK